MSSRSGTRAPTAWRRSWRMVLFVAIAVAIASGTAYGAFVGLPSGAGQVNNDPPTIDPAQNVNVVDLTTGSLTGAARVPWAAFAQAQAGSSAVNIVVRAFKNGAWQTEGFPESLNHDSTQTAAAPSIDFTGANRTVPWVTWNEPVTPLSGVQNIFASRFISQPAPAQNGGQWVPEGPARASGVPSLNINTNREATDASLIGGTTIAGGNPAPWITWQEADNGAQSVPTNGNGNSRFEIFVSHAVPAASTGGACPALTQPTSGGAGNSVSNFCFQDVGIPRVAGPGLGQLDPSLNVDPTRDGIQADISFTGPNDTVPWVVWYENSDHGNTTLPGLLNADMVFAARAVADPNPGVNGKFHWQVVGLGTAGKTAADNILNANQTTGCAASGAAEQACSLDAFSGAALTDGNGAENPEVTAGTMVQGKATTPWVAWDESSVNGGPHSVFVARLDPAGDHFDLLNNGQPISHSGLDSTRPDIVFAGNTPYVSWRETNGSSQTVTLVGHFEGNPASPVFHIDTPAIPSTAPVKSDDDATDVRSPIASTCPADPFTVDGSACSGGAIGTPFFAYTSNATGPRQLFAQGYTPGTTTTGTASAVTKNMASVVGTVSTDGAPTRVHFDFGTSTAYGSSTAAQLLAPASGVSTPVTASLGSLPAGKVIHYRVVAQTDFGTVPGPDRTFKTLSNPAASKGSLTGVSKSKPKLSFTLTAGTGLVKFAVSLPKGLRFSTKAKNLAKGVTVTAAGKHVKLKLKVSHGTLTITLKGAPKSVKVTISGKAITVSSSLASKVRHKKVKTLTVIIKATDSTKATTRLVLKVKPR